jgi:membrane protease YdiL (CAAX protease family)
MDSDTRKQIGLQLFGLLFTIGFPTLLISKVKAELSDVSHLVGYETMWWAAVAAVLLYVLFAEKRPLSSVGYRRPRMRDIGIAIAAGTLILTGVAFIFFVILPALHLDESPQVGKLLTLPLWWRLILVVRGVVAEELFYRGYAIERLQEISRSRAVAGIFSCAVFTCAHIGTWGGGHLLIAGFAGIILTGLYLWRRNLWVNMIAHSLVDCVGVLAA